ncbi:MAG: hypothetical protein HYV27_17910 [Candidatus Hydrogenedentes bacterium]|nr:hypothetical protein [Candidatus Hydrogenedentota bacterium]
MTETSLTSRSRLRPPTWVAAAICLLAAIEPVSHWAIETFPPAGTVPTGAHTVDTTNYLVGMAYGHSPWYSPYARCTGDYAAGDPSLFSLVHHRMYGMIGQANRVFGISPFWGLAWANALGAAFSVWAAWIFLAVAAPRLARGAFLLYALGGGLGGVLYLLSVACGWTEHPDFAARFLRYFYYELCEGPRFQPWLMVSRLYYTLSLGCGLLALVCWLRTLQRGHFRDVIFSATLLGVCTVLNLRLGPMFWGVALIMMCTVTVLPWRRRAALFVLPTAGLIVAAVGVLRLAALNPELYAGVAINARSALWLSPFVSATVFYWLLVPQALPRALHGAPAWLGRLGMGAVGYLAAFVLLYAGYQFYYGNVWHCADVMVAVRFSDWALLGVPVGTLLAPWALRRAEFTDADAPPWAALWLLAYLPIALSAWGQGWFLRVSPDRFVITLGIPMALLAASTLSRWQGTRPRLVRSIYAVMVICGLCAIAVTWSVTYGPWGYRTLQRHYDWTRFAFMDAADATLMEHIEGGVVLAPSLGAPLFGDLAALRPNTKAVYGNGTLDYSRDVMPEVRTAVAVFYSGGTPETARRALVERWCVQYVYCPATEPVADAVREELRPLPWLEPVASAGRGILFRVRD